ncbi:hypothetical protein PRIPAC_85090 [Pristionchus pacificus]|uniref:Uncharacterized protein n=1 Tax=Pristionchus pacificus TaxID=54126 RepID=A0A2A6CCI2_PRIPA|nr:hypothetical protein PRIPAC_85090 [Pristionchus pacificus]|eukprot:PDM75721.1 hypothetical protein PRIPAC_40100 [Pristionchus pacificus]
MALVLPIDGSIAEERLNALALAGGWNVSAAIFCDDKPHERRGACEQKFLKRKTPRPVANEDSELAKGTLVNNVCVIPTDCPTQAIALEKLIRVWSSIFNDYIENGVKFESLDLPRKEEEAVGFIAIQFIKNLQHGCNGIKPDVVKKCLEDGIPKPVEYEHKGLASID